MFSISMCESFKNPCIIFLSSSLFGLEICRETFPSFDSIPLSTVLNLLNLNCENVKNLNDVDECISESGSILLILWYITDATICA